MCESVLYNRWTIYLAMLVCCWFLLIQLRLECDKEAQAVKLRLIIKNWGMSLLHACCITLPIVIADLQAQEYITARASVYWMFIVPFMFDCVRSVASNVLYMHNQLTLPSVLNVDNFLETMFKLTLLLGFKFFSMLEMLLLFFYCVQKFCAARIAQQRHNN